MITDCNPDPWIRYITDRHTDPDDGVCEECRCFEDDCECELVTDDEEDDDA